MLRQFALLIPVLLLVACGKKDAPVARAKPETHPALIERALPGENPGSQTAAEEEPVPPDEALAMALRIESASEREMALAEVAWNAIETDPEIAHEAFRHLPADSPERIRLIRHYAMSLAEDDPEAALEWAGARATATESAAAKGQVALAIAEKDPARAATLVAESGLAGRELDVLVVEVVQRWAATSPPEAAAWVAKFQPGPAREAGSKAVAERWLPQDASAAFAWLRNEKDSGHRGEIARAVQGVILQQPKEVRDVWLEKAGPGIRGELEQQREAVMKEVGDNIPQDAR